jgi:Flp pilus assembly protein TadG
LVELTIVLPVMFLVILGSIDLCNSIFAKQFLTEITYLGALEGATSGLEESDLNDLVNSYLAARNIDNATVTIEGVDGTPFDLVARGELFEVVIHLAASDRVPSPVIIQHTDLSARSVAARQ